MYECIPEESSLDSQCFHALVEPAFMPRGLVLIHNALVDHAVDDRYGVFVGRLCGGFVAGITGLDDVLDLGAHAGAQTHVVLASFLGLPGAFSR